MIIRFSGSIGVSNLTADTYNTYVNIEEAIERAKSIMPNLGSRYYCCHIFDRHGEQKLLWSCNFEPTAHVYQAKLESIKD